MMGWRRFGRPALGIGLLAVVLVGADPLAVLARLGTINLGLAAVAMLGLTAIHLVGAMGWRSITLETSGVLLPRRPTVALYYAAQAIGGVTPANLGGDVHRVLALRSRGRDWSAAVAPVIVQRATSYLALSILSLAGLAVLADRTRIAGPIVGAGFAFAFAVIVAAWVLLAPPAPLRGLHLRLTRLVSGNGEAGTRPGRASVEPRGSESRMGSPSTQGASV